MDWNNKKIESQIVTVNYFKCFIEHRIQNSIAWCFGCFFPFSDRIWTISNAYQKIHLNDGFLATNSLVIYCTIANFSAIKRHCCTFNVHSFAYLWIYIKTFERAKEISKKRNGNEACSLQWFSTQTTFDYFIIIIHYYSTWQMANKIRNYIFNNNSFMSRHSSPVAWLIEFMKIIIFQQITWIKLINCI